MYDSGSQVYSLLLELFPKKMTTGDYRFLVFDMMDPALSDDERHAARDALRDVIGIDPLFEVHWARAVAENPELEDRKEENRRILFDAYYNKNIDSEARIEKRAEWEEALGEDPLEEDGIMHDWDS